MFELTESLLDPRELISVLKLKWGALGYPGQWGARLLILCDEVSVFVKRAKV
jgi:hypothetical protein